MYLKIVGNSFTENVFKEIAGITDRSILDFNRVEYDEKNRIMSLPIERYKIKQKKKLLGSIAPYKHDKSKRIQTLVIIRNIVECKIENILEDTDVSKVTLLFGVMIEGKEISITSAEEERGNTCYSIRLKVDELDIEIQDKDTIQEKEEGNT